MTRSRFGMATRGLRVSTGALIVVVAVTLSACTGITLADKVGVDQPERVLILADASIPGSLSTPAISQFVAAVSSRSHHQLQIDVHTGVSDTAGEGRTVTDVGVGRVDLGWAEVNTLEAMGATSLRPLLVPLLVDSYPIQAEVLKRHTSELLADVPAAAGVTPLALFAGGLRFVASTDHPVVTAADWQGRQFWTTSAGQQEAGLRALGATPVVDPRDRQTLVQAGIIDSAETSWRAYPASLTFVAPNVRLWPRAVVLIANPSMVRSLTAEQRGWLDTAAADATTWSLTHAEDADTPALEAACRNGTRAGLAHDDQLTAMRALGRKTLRQADMPSWGGDLAQEVERLRQRPGFEPTVNVPAGCGYTVADAKPRAVGHREPLTGPGPIGELSPGTYRYALSGPDILRASNGGANADYLSQNVGRWTWTIEAGRWTLDMRPTDSTFPSYPCAGWLSVSADIATFTRTVNGVPGGDCVPLVWSARFRLDNGVLRWTETDVTDFGWVFQSVGWRPIS